MKRLYHPICHLIHGEKLYYIVVSFRQDALNSANYLLEKLEELEIINSSCAHFIFGDMDVLIRAGSDEKSINDFKEYLDSLKLIDSYRFLLIENIKAPTMTTQVICVIRKLYAILFLMENSAMGNINKSITIIAEISEMIINIKSVKNSRNLSFKLVFS